MMFTCSARRGTDLETSVSPLDKGEDKGEDRETLPLSLSLSLFSQRR